MMCFHLAMAVVLASLQACICSGEVGVVAEPRDVTQLWCGYDPRAMPLDIELKEEKLQNDVHIQRLYFNGEPGPKGSVRVYAIAGIPAGVERVPGILHVHGGGQTASMEWVRYWTRRGYAAVSLDWCGEVKTRMDFTRWNGIKANMMTDGQDRTVVPSMRESPWYHWALVSRRALTLLEQLPGVDRERLGLFGVSMGATITWMLAGIDERVRTAVPIYGCGWNTYPDVHSGGGYAHPVPPEIELWRATMEPETYARYITCPLLQLNATNDFHAHMDRCYDTVARVRAPTWQSMTPRYSHHLEPDQGRTLERWMHWQLKGGETWPAPPQVSLENGPEQCVVRVNCSGAQQVERVAAFSYQGDKRPQTRFWHSVKLAADGSSWKGLVPIKSGKQLRVLANVTYRDGYTLTSAQAIVDAPQTSRPETPSLLIDDFADGVDDWTFGPAYTDPHLEWSYLARVEGPDGAAALTLTPQAAQATARAYCLGTHKVGDPAWQAPAGATLTFLYRGAAGSKLEVHALVDHWGPRFQEYVATIPLSESTQWQTIEVSPKLCKTKDGSALTGFRSVDRIEFTGSSPSGAPPRFAMIRWKPPSASAPAS